MAKKKNPNRKKLQIKGKYGEKSKFYGKSDQEIESIKKRKRDKEAEQQANKTRRDRRKRLQAKGKGRFAPPPDTGPTPTPVEFNFEMPDVEGMLDTQADIFTSQLDAMREDDRLAAEEQRRFEAEAQRQFELSERTMLGNEARSGQQAKYKFGSISGRKRGGTFGFRRRKRRLMGGIGSAVSAGSGGGTLNM
jgi:hypothetical protein